MCLHDFLEKKNSELEWKAVFGDKVLEKYHQMQRSLYELSYVWKYYIACWGNSIKRKETIIEMKQSD